METLYKLNAMKDDFEKLLIENQRAAKTLRCAIYRAMIFPIFVLCVSVIAFAIEIFYIIPEMYEMYKDLPLF